MTDSGNGPVPDPQGQDPQRHPPPSYPQGPPPQYPHPQNNDMGKPGVIPLRPLALGEIIDGAFATMRRYAGVVFGSAAVVALVGAVIGILLDRLFLPSPTAIDENASLTEQSEQLQESLGSSLVGSSFAIIVMLLTQVFLTGMLTVVVGRAVLGRAVHFGEVWQEFRPRFLPLLGVTLITAVLSSIGMFLFIIPGIWVYVLLSLAAPALVLEHNRVGASLSRSRDLVQGSWWRVFGVLIVAMIVVVVVSFIIQLPFELGVDPFEELTMGELLLSELGTAVATTITAPFVASVAALLYIDQRMRREGLDIELARNAGQQ